MIYVDAKYDIPEIVSLFKSAKLAIYTDKDQVNAVISTECYSHRASGLAINGCL